MPMTSTRRPSKPKTSVKLSESDTLLGGAAGVEGDDDTALFDTMTVDIEGVVSIVVFVMNIIDEYYWGIE